MATWRADVFVNSNVGRISTEVEAATFSGAKEQIYAKHGNVQSITNLRQVRRNSTSSSDGEVSDGTVAFVFLCLGIWAFISFAPIILMGVSGALGTWIGEKLSGQSLSEYAERSDDSGHGKAAFVFALALIMGGFGFVKGIDVKNYFNEPSTPSSEVKPK